MSKSESLGAAQRQRRSVAENRRIVEETLVEGASVARVARAPGINANHLLRLAQTVSGRATGRRKARQKLIDGISASHLPSVHLPYSWTLSKTVQFGRLNPFPGVPRGITEVIKS